MTIEQRQQAARDWAHACERYEAAMEEAERYHAIADRARKELADARDALLKVACVGCSIRTRVFMMPAGNTTKRYLVKVTYTSAVPNSELIELLQTEPNE